ncbi:MAG TPA: hypothetical protein VFS64_01130 [Solirubrobacterales bacterium]|nr:hypothetical protein [Solirubrobacterales bacterium]
MEAVRRTNARLAEIEAEYFERSEGAPDLPVLRVFAMRAPKGTKADSGVNSPKKDAPPI